MAKAAKRSRLSVKRAPRVAERKAKRATRNEGTEELRGRLLDLTGGYCEYCGEMPIHGTGHTHHTEGGGGRVQRQHIGNVAWLCPTCHRAMHAHPMIARAFREAIREKRLR